MEFTRVRMISLNKCRPPEFMEQAMSERAVGYTANGVTYVRFGRGVLTTWTESPRYGTVKPPPPKSNVVSFTAPGKSPVKK